MRIKTVLAGAALLGLVILGSIAHVAGADNPQWTLRINPGPAIVNHKEFTIEYIISSPVATDRFAIELYQGRDTRPISTAKTNKDFGEGGLFTVNTNSDGDYIYHLKAINLVNNESQTADSKVTVDTLAPPVPTNLQVTANDQGSSISFSIDPNQGVVQYLIYGSKNPNFKLDASSFIIKQQVTNPLEPQSYDYVTAGKPINYFAVVARDKAGNNSAAAVLRGTSVDDSSVINDGSISYSDNANLNNKKSSAFSIKNIYNQIKGHWKIIAAVLGGIALLVGGYFIWRQRRNTPKPNEPIEMDIDF